MRRDVTLLIVAGVFLSGCGGPLISQSLSFGVQDQGTPHGTYCLPRHLLEVTVVTGDDEGEEGKRGKHLVATWGPTAVYATRRTEDDTSRMYQLNYNESSFSSDTITVSYSKRSRCLLERVYSKVRDDSPSVIRDLASTMIQASTGVPTARVRGARTRAGGKDRAGEVGVLPDKITMLLDVGPETYRKEQDRLNDSLAAHEFPVSVEIRPMAAATSAREDGSSDDRAVEGIFYAPPQAYVLSILGKQATGKAAVVDESVFYSSNGVPVHYVAIDRSMFVERQTEVKFYRGLPYSIVTRKPSEAREFAAIPLDITTAILEVPAQALQLEAEEARLRGAVYQNQEIMIQRQMRLIQAQDNLLKFMQDRKSVTVPDQVESAREVAPASTATSPNTGGVTPADEELPNSEAETPDAASDEIPDGDNSAPPE